MTFAHSTARRIRTHTRSATHDLRRRAITLAGIANKGNVDGAAKALSIHPDTARENYIDVSQAYDTDAIFKLLEATAK
ncbi:MAG: hypothetical protein K8U57_30965 [Planctomycetes bacterium]|nr:hypothetical protein [Planctomycetota bacterium]